MTTEIPPEHRQAIARFESYARSDPDNTHILVNLGDLYHRAGMLEQATASYRKVLELEPAHGVARSRLAGVALSAHRFADAEHELRALLEAGADEPALRHNLGLALFYQERFDEALSCFEEAAASGTKLPRNLAYRAFCLHHLRQFDEARDCARQWAQQESSTEAHGYLSLLEMDHGDVEEARRRAAAVLAHEPDNPDAGVVVGTGLLEDQQMEQAVDLFRRILARDPGNPRIRLCLGMVHLYRQEFDPAIDAIGQAVKLMPNNGGARVTLGWAHLLKKDLGGAERVFAEAVERHRSFSEAHGGYAAVLALLGRRQEARQSLRRALGLDRACFGAVFAQSMLLEQSGKRDMAVKLVEQALTRQLRPGAPTLIEAVQTYARKEAAKGVGHTPEPAALAPPTRH